jgi:hypothetical protein
MKRVYVKFNSKKWLEYLIVGERLIRSDSMEWVDQGGTEAVFHDDGNNINITINKKTIRLDYQEAQAVLAILTHTSDVKIKIK